MIIHYFKQQSAEWELERKNKITGSRAGEFKPKVRGSGFRAGFFEMLADDIDTELHDMSPMDWGNANEPKARQFYEELTGNKIVEVGLCIHDEFPFIAYSPDGMVEKKVGKKTTYPIGLEIKCPTTKTYVEYFLETCVNGDTVNQEQVGIDKVPSQYREQVIQSFVVNETQKEMHFLIYNPTLEKNNWIMITVYRDEVAEEAKDQLEWLKQGYESYLKAKELFINF